MSDIFLQFWQACFSASLLSVGSLVDIVYMLEDYTETCRLNVAYLEWVTIWSDSPQSRKSGIKYYHRRKLLRRLVQLL